MNRRVMKLPGKWKFKSALCVAVALVYGSCARSQDSENTQAARSTLGVQAAAAAPSAAHTLDPSLAAGELAYAKYCALCHAKDATGYAADNAPSLVSRMFLESATDSFIAAGIRMGRPGTAMAAYSKARGGPLNERDIQNLVRYLRSKGPASQPLPVVSVTGDPQRGKTVFEQNCQTCHGTATTRGNAVSLVNPELLNAASPAFLRHAIVNGRPPTPMLPFRDKLSDPQIDDVVAWLWSFKPALPTPQVKDPAVPKDLPVVLNPKGKSPDFTLRDGRFVSAEQVKRALAAKQRVVIIDARPASEWIQFRIPGAIPLPYHDSAQLDRVPNDGTWVIAYCACPHHASGEVVDALRAKNYPKTAVMDEGILFWRAQGYPLVGEAVEPKR